MSMEKQNPLGHLRQTQQSILNTLSHLDELNIKYKQKQDKSFMSTFLQVMDKMSTQLYQAYQHFDNIDKQICTDAKCSFLMKQLDFFKGQSLQLLKQLGSVNAEIEREKNKKKQLQIVKNGVNNALKDKIRVIEKYRSLGHRSNKSSKQRELESMSKSIDLDGHTTCLSNRKEIVQLNLKDVLELKKKQASVQMNYRDRVRIRNSVHTMRQDKKQEEGLANVRKIKIQSSERFNKTSQILFE